MRYLPDVNAKERYDGETFCYFDSDCKKLFVFDESEKSWVLYQKGNPNHWILTEPEYLDCSNCGKSYYTGCASTAQAKVKLRNKEVYNYCPYCGVEMNLDYNYE